MQFILSLLLFVFFLSIQVKAEGLPPSNFKEEQDKTFIQATLLMARYEQPGLLRYQFSQEEYELIKSIFGNLKGLSAKVIKVMPMKPLPGDEDKGKNGWVMEVGDTWNALFQIEKVEKNRQRKEVYQTWPLVEFRRGKIFFLKEGVQVSDGLKARVAKRIYVFKKDKGWLRSKEDE